jgi:sulfite reductase (NADPH) hemoprotein beta-component
LNNIYRTDILEADILSELDSLFAAFKTGRHDGETFGDFTFRTLPQLNRLG